MENIIITPPVKEGSFLSNISIAMNEISDVLPSQTEDIVTYSDTTIISNDITSNKHINPLTSVNPQHNETLSNTRLSGKSCDSHLPINDKNISVHINSYTDPVEDNLIIKSQNVDKTCPIEIQSNISHHTNTSICNSNVYNRVSYRNNNIRYPQYSTPEPGYHKHYSPRNVPRSFPLYTPQFSRFRNSTDRESMPFYTNKNHQNSEFSVRRQYPYKKYNPIDNCRSAGVIPYCLKEGHVYFLFQKSDLPFRKKDDGWNDFGGKKAIGETTFETAAREFSEETSCLFYLREQQMFDEDLYNSLKNNSDLNYSPDTIEKLKQLIPVSKKYYCNKISQYASPLYTSSKEIYIIYFVKVEYIPAENLPCAEDIHIPYEERYKRTCQWLSLSQILLMSENQFHKRLQITKIQNRIDNFNTRNLFS